MKKHLLLMGFVALVLLLVGCASGGDSESEIATLVAEQLLLTGAAFEPGATSAVPASSTPDPGSSPTPELAAEATLDIPVVVFLPGGLFDEAERNLIMEKVTNPFIHYYADLEDHPRLLTITIEHYEEDPTWLYTAEAIFEGGGYIGWLVPATGGEPDWWIPDCMGPCLLSDSFRSAYPDIVSTLEP